MDSATTGETVIDTQAMSEASDKVVQLLKDAKQSDDVVQIYDKWTDYDKDLGAIYYRSPVVTADVVAEYIVTDMRSQVIVMDIACGTGIAGQEVCTGMNVGLRMGAVLQKRGFTVIDGLDPSAKSLDLARPKNVYRRLICDYVTEKPLDIEDATYDVVVTCGAIAPGYLPAVSIHEFLRICKTDGLICMTGRKVHWDNFPEYNDVMKPLLQQLQDEGKLKILIIETMPKFFYLASWQDGIIIVLRKI